MAAPSERVEVLIEKIVAGGDGLGRASGRVVFVPDTAPGERHLVEVVEARKDFSRARSIERLETSAARREPPCPHYQRCGGCRLMHLLPNAQLEAKRGILAESLERQAGLSAPSPRVVGSPELAYRLRLRFHVALVGGEPVLGLRRRGSHEVVDIDRCLLGTEALAGVWSRVRRLFRTRPLLARHVVAVELADSSAEPGRVTARFFVRSPDDVRKVQRDGEETLLEALGVAGVVVEVDRGGPISRSGTTAIEHRVGKFTLRQSTGSFFQTNRFLLEPLVELALPPAEEGRAERALDLYSGVGLFSLPLAARAERVLGIEASPLALADAKHNAARAGLDNVGFRRDDAARFLRRGSLRAGDLVLADPPRGGLDPSVREVLARSPLGRFRYVSCDPPAFARDAGALARAGFRLERIALADLFPNTHLFETVAVLSRER